MTSSRIIIGQNGNPLDSSTPHYTISQLVVITPVLP